MSDHRPALPTTLLIAVVTAATAGLGAAVSGGSTDAWYAALNKPALNPPDMVFGIVWPILYGLMAIGAVLVRIKAGSFRAASSALGLYFTQLALNLSWSWLFFGFHQVALSMVALGALWMLIIAMMHAFSKHSVAAAILQLPYLLWVSFAGYLNVSILSLN